VLRAGQRRHLTRAKWRQGHRAHLRSSRWAAIRAECKRRAGWRCTKCGSTRHLQAHHHRYPKRWTDDSVENVVCLCERCHKAVSRRIYWRGVRARVTLLLLGASVLAGYLLHN
jgi:5-methylcytosine-specific restriction endonuclease McrA